MHPSPRHAASIALALCALACAATPAPGGGGGGGGTGGILTGTGQGASDAGSAPDAGVCVPAPDDDGTGATGVVVSEIRPGADGFVELFVASGPGLPAATTEVFADNRRLTLPRDLAAGEHVVIAAPGLGTTAEAVVRSGGSLVSYACWGSLGPTSEQNAAVIAGSWASPGSCALSPPATDSLHCTGTCRFAADYAAGPPTPGACR